LSEFGLVKVLFTQDGKNYITPLQIEREIKVQIKEKGRINLIELQPLLNIDLSHIELKVDEIMKKDPQLQLVQGEIITNEWLDGMAEEINDLLQESGQVSLSELAKRFTFTAEFLTEAIEKRLNKLIYGRFEAGILYTKAFVARRTAQVRGVFSAITGPTNIAHLSTEYGFQDILFQSVLSSLIENGRLSGVTQGAKLFTPTIFSQARIEFITSFFKQNSYIAYSTLSQMQINEPRNFMQNRFTEGVALDTCYIDKNLVAQIDAVIDESIQSESWVNVTTLVPSPLSKSDIHILLLACPSIQESKNKVIVLEDVYTVSQGLIDRCVRLFDNYLKDQIEKSKLQNTATSEFLSANNANKEEIEDDNEDRKSKKKTKKTNEKEKNKK